MIATLSLGSLEAQSGFDKAYKKDWETSKQFTLAIVDAMPAEKYGFKVSLEEMPYATLMIHIATSQAMRFAQIADKL